MDKFCKINFPTLRRAKSFRAVFFRDTGRKDFPSVPISLEPSVPKFCADFLTKKLPPLRAELFIFCNKSLAAYKKIQIKKTPAQKTGALIYINNTYLLAFVSGNLGVMLFEEVFGDLREEGVA